MAITLTVGQAVHTLPQDLTWPDRFAWSPVESERRWGTNGAQHLHVGVRQAGRPITLEGSQEHAWMSHAQAETMRALAADPATVMVLKLHDGSEYTVMFDHTRDDAFRADPVEAFTDPQDTDWVIPTLRLIEIGADEDDQDPEP